jgi:uncharacterized repeat protein (TIGR03803 family)
MTTAHPLSFRKPLTLALILLALGAASAAQVKFELLYSFKTGFDGNGPRGSLVADKQGNLYGTTAFGGSFADGNVFELSQPSHSGEAWTETVLYSFQSTTGEQPQAGLVFDSEGNLYGTTYYGGVGDYGIVFELSPPEGSGSVWSETTLYDFESGVQIGGPGGLLRRAGGTLFGTTSDYNGGVYALKPPTGAGGAWKESTLFLFDGGVNGDWPVTESGALVADAAGNLYGTTGQGGEYSWGEVFELSPPKAAGEPWTETVLYSFGGYGTDGLYPAAGLVLDEAGNLYSTTLLGGVQGLGTVFELSPPTGQSHSWTETVLHNFAGGTSDGAQSFSGLVRDKGGNLYGVTYQGGPGDCYYNYPGCGTVFEVSLAGGKWSESVLHSFNGDKDGQFPYAGLMIDDSNHLFGATSAGGANGNGTVFEVVP